MSDPSRLIAVLLDVERHVSELGWDQPARLFALVSTRELLQMEPQLAGRVPEGVDDGMSAVEQDEFHAGEDLFERLASIYFPDTVEGVALSLERTFLPSAFEADVPERDDEAVEFVRNHPEHQDVRAVVGVLRDGSRYGLARIKSHPDDLLQGTDVIPNLPDALAQTLRSEA
ncbi:PPA1309 family protein [uncultured Tessaracoccus sp.]|uniref:PPA1309 family protein n=1 Tax=uncultured Tessaracoccus sp. TaxID=905023 RepID=UPI002635B5C8|nr:PPA1309 family protein [uncultured Tessaracoccus sp.]